MENLYETSYRESIENSERFWANAAKEIDWITPWDRVLDDQNEPYFRWFVGAECNTCFNALDRHVNNGRANQLALIYDSPVTGNVVKSFTYRELRDLVARFAGVLQDHGVSKGDRVLIYMPLIPEAIIAMLASARIGAVHSVVFGGFASNELAIRIDDAKPKVIVSASCGIEVDRLIEYLPLLDEAIDIAHYKVEKCIIFGRPELPSILVEGRDSDWSAAMEVANFADCVTVQATDPLYILYTSGTTGEPKGVVRDNGGHMVALKWSMKNVYDINPGDVFWTASDVGWVVGHSYIVYAPLLHGCTTLLYEGKPVGTPDAGAFWRVIAQHKVKALFTAPTAFRAIKREDPNASLLKKYDLINFKYLFLAGERLDPDTLRWAEKHLNVPVIDHWWQTESGWPMVSNCMGLHPFPIRPGSPTKPVPGWDIKILDSANQEVEDGEIGSICVRLPMPPSSLLTLWNRDLLFEEKYLSQNPGYYLTSDAGFKDEDGYFYIMTRTDDIINVAGHRLSTGGMEEVLAEHEDVAECAVVGVDDRLKGQLPVGFLVLSTGVLRSHELIISEVITMVRKKIGPVAAFRNAVIVPRLPKTRSGKILRGIIQKIADKKEYRLPATIDDPSILLEIDHALQSIGYSSARLD